MNPEHRYQPPSCLCPDGKANARSPDLQALPSSAVRCLCSHQSEWQARCTNKCRHPSEPLRARCHPRCYSDTYDYGRGTEYSGFRVGRLHHACPFEQVSSVHCTPMLHSTRSYAARLIPTATGKTTAAIAATRQHWAAPLVDAAAVRQGMPFATSVSKTHLFECGLPGRTCRCSQQMICPEWRMHVEPQSLQVNLKVGRM